MVAILGGTDEKTFWALFDELTGREDDCLEAFHEALDAVQETWTKPEEEVRTVGATVRIGTPRLDALFPAETGPGT